VTLRRRQRASISIFAPKEMLANLLEVLGADQRIAGEAAERIVGWRTPPKASSTTAEEARYTGPRV